MINFVQVEKYDGDKLILKKLICKTSKDYPSVDIRMLNQAVQDVLGIEKNRFSTLNLSTDEIYSIRKFGISKLFESAIDAKEEKAREKHNRKKIEMKIRSAKKSKRLNEEQLCHL